MKQQTFVLALLVSVSAIGVAVASSTAEGTSSPDAQSQSAPASTQGGDGATRVAEGFFENLWGGGRRGEGRGEHETASDDDDDDGGVAQGRNGAANLADPNSANAPVPDSGVFAGKARPKVEVQ